MEQALALFEETGRMHLEVGEEHTLCIEAIDENFMTSEKAFYDLLGAIRITETLEGDATTVTIGNEVGKVIFPFLAKQHIK